jgi:hypothetical protein
MSAQTAWEELKTKELAITTESLKTNLTEFVMDMLEMFEEVFKKGYQTGYDEAKAETENHKASTLE